VCLRAVHSFLAERGGSRPAGLRPLAYVPCTTAAASSEHSTGGSEGGMKHKLREISQRLNHDGCAGTT
jgi:hypothetical protein